MASIHSSTPLNSLSTPTSAPLQSLHFPPRPLHFLVAAERLKARRRLLSLRMAAPERMGTTAEQAAQRARDAPTRASQQAWRHYFSWPRWRAPASSTCPGRWPTQASRCCCVEAHGYNNVSGDSIRAISFTTAMLCLATNTSLPLCVVQGGGGCR